jgi:hypothetical protein
MYSQPIRFPQVFGAFAVDVIGEHPAPGSRRASWSADETRINRTYTNQVLVSCTQRAGPLAIISAIGVKIGDTYRFPLFSGTATESDTGSFVQSIEPESDSEDGRQWRVTIEYGPFDVPTMLGTSYLAQGLVDPTEKPWQVFWDNAKYSISKTEDFSDPPKPFVNTANDALLDPPEIEETRPVLKLVHVEPNYNEAVANSFRDTVNQDVFLGCPPNTVKCRDIKGERVWDSDWGWAWTLTYEFEFRVDEAGDGFKLKILNAGYRYKKGGTGAPINADDGQGKSTNDFVLLQKNGDKLPDGAAPYLLEFVEFPPSDFSLLGIPEDLFD